MKIRKWERTPRPAVAPEAPSGPKKRFSWLKFSNIKSSLSSSSKTVATSPILAITPLPQDSQSPTAPFRFTGNGGKAEVRKLVRAVEAYTGNRSNARGAEISNDQWKVNTARLCMTTPRAEEWWNALDAGVREDWDTFKEQLFERFQKCRDTSKAIPTPASPPPPRVRRRSTATPDTMPLDLYATVNSLSPTIPSPSYAPAGFHERTTSLVNANETSQISAPAPAARAEVLKRFGPTEGHIRCVPALDGGYVPVVRPMHVRCEVSSDDVQTFVWFSSETALALRWLTSSACAIIVDPQQSGYWPIECLQVYPDGSMGVFWEGYGDTFTLDAVVVDKLQEPSARTARQLRDPSSSMITRSPTSTGSTFVTSLDTIEDGDEEEEEDPLPFPPVKDPARILARALGLSWSDSVELPMVVFVRARESWIDDQLLKLGGDTLFQYYDARLVFDPI